MESQDQKQAEKQTQHEAPKMQMSRMTEVTPVFPFPAGVTRADRRRVADVAARFVRD